MDYLQQAVYALYNSVGSIKQISPVYKTDAQGFKGDSFLNCAIHVTTTLSIEEVIDKTQKIEQKLGRLPKKGDAYSSRVIDIDLLLYEDQEIATSKVIVPHPRMHLRDFVLYPMCDIAASQIHPLYKVDMQHLKNKLQQQTPPQRISDTLKMPSHFTFLSNYKYIAIEGNIGAGKTSLATMMSQDFGAKLILERFKDNPFLPQFYKDQNRYAFPLEMSFLADRYQQLLEDIRQLDLFNDLIIADYDVFKSLIFAKVTLQEEEYALYKKLFFIMHKELPKPDVYVYLYQNTDRLLENIKKRGRSYEQSIEASYLQKINDGYLEFIKNKHDKAIKIIDISDKDFVANRADYLEVISNILAE